MNRVLIIFGLFACSFIFVSCSTIDKFITPQQQCLLIRTGASAGLNSVVNKEVRGDIEENIEKYKSTLSSLQNEVLPLLKKKLDQKGSLTKKEWENILSTLKKNLSESQAFAFQKVLEQIFSFTEPPGSSEEGEKDLKYIGKRALKLLMCAVQGAIDTFANQLGQSKSVKSLSDKIEETCLECEDMMNQ